MSSRNHLLNQATDILSMCQPIHIKISVISRSFTPLNRGTSNDCLPSTPASLSQTSKLPNPISSFSKSQSQFQVYLSKPNFAEQSNSVIKNAHCISLFTLEPMDFRFNV